MAERSPQGQQDRAFHFENVSIFKDEDSQLGVGSYGAVYKAKCDQLPCAAKILHPALFQTNDPGSRRIKERFEQECGFLSGIKHPNIVQYLGLYRDGDSQLPVLLMELLDSSLTKFLETSNKPLPYHVQVDLCFDIALAIAYLHSNDIIHRDLSGNNVLIVAGSRAKVTDFGMSKLVDASSHITRRTLTQCPGTEVYMPPEALREPPVYTMKLDCFSFGVLVIQTLTRLYPNPGPRRREIPSPLSPMGIIEVPVADVERRKEQMDMIAPTHPLLPVATECLKYGQEDRPSVQQLCEQLAPLKEAFRYSESKQRMQESSSPAGNDMTDKDRMIQELQQQVHEKDHVIQEKDHVIQEKERVIQEKDHMVQENNNVIQEKDHVIQEKERVIQEKDHVIQEKDMEIQGNCRVIADKDRMLRDLNERFQDNEQVVSEFQQTLTQREQENQVLRERLSARDSDNSDLQRQLQPLRVEQAQAKLGNKMTKKRSITLRWRDGGRAPEMMYFGSCTVGRDAAYIRNHVSDTIHSHNAATGKWNTLPKCPREDFTLVVVNGLLTAVGGYDSSYKATSASLLSLVREGKWVERLPPMPTKRHLTAAVVSGRTLVVVGGWSDVRLKTVELLDIDSLQWFIASELPHPHYSASAAICGDNLYLVSGYGENGPTKSVLTCSVSALVRSARPATIGGWLRKTFSQTEQVWRQVASLPVVHSICAALNGRLITVGGWDSDSEKTTNSVHSYDPTTDHWDVISSMPTARYRCLVAVLPGNQLMVVGGFTESEATAKVEVAAF